MAGISFRGFKAWNSSWPHWKRQAGECAQSIKETLQTRKANLAAWFATFYQAA